MTLDAKIEAILFFKGEPISFKNLASLAGVKESEVKDALTLLEGKLSDRGVRLVFKENEVMLATSANATDLITKITKEELSRDLGRAGLETLSVILYRGPISRKEIDYIRGVNSAFIVRNLLIRGLVERVTSGKDERVFLYKPTLDLISYLGLSRIEDLPEYAEVRKEIETHEKAAEEVRAQEDKEEHGS
jgi:segregation and condensation protein B